MTVTDRSGRVVVTGELEDYLSVDVVDELGTVLYTQHTLVVRCQVTGDVLHSETTCERTPDRTLRWK